MVFVSVSILLSGKYDGSFVLLSCEITRMIIHCPNVQWLHDENLDNVVFGSQTRRENELILWGSNRSNLWKFVILPEGLLRSRPTRGYQIKNVWINWSLSTLQLIIERHSSTGIMNEWWNWGEKTKLRRGWRVISCIQSFLERRICCLHGSVGQLAHNEQFHLVWNLCAIDQSFFRGTCLMSV